MSGAFFLGVDVGTGSARAGIFDRAGVMRGSAVQAIETFRPAEDFVEQSSENIWHACGVAVRAALAQAALRPEQIAGLAFDATCSLVALGADDAPVSVSPTGRPAQNVIVWMDHRALAEADSINATGHEVLRYVGGVISPEMETPKLLWLKRHLPASFAKTARFLDLPDFLSYRATGNDARSHCTTVCKWTYLGHENGGRGAWSASFFEQIGLAELLLDGARRIGAEVRPVGERVGSLSERAAQELGLSAGIPVAVSVIDAHAGGIGLLGGTLDGETLDADAFDTRLALIGGTSSCHMAVSREPRFVSGVWGPYYSAMLPDMWLTEGGQSATGALIDHVLQSHARYAELAELALARQSSVYALLNERLDALSAGGAVPGALTRDLHVLPDHHGNRSPRADPTLRGTISGLKLSASVDQLALEYLATIQAIAHGTRHIIDTMNAHGYRISTVIATGGDSKNPVFLREHADATGARLLLPREPEAVLLGSAILAARAAGEFPCVVQAMTQMSSVARMIEPNPAAHAFHDGKHRVFLRMHADQLAYRDQMAEVLGSRA
ncbi:MAG TPA: FGGY-family carbohydrate kinase [Polyangiaceae bacterium]|jgi:FGGY-family pentulose kinase|nr:FGGY-family carbohydrate kinase [Polyangiaceae bacterium]